MVRNDPKELLLVAIGVGMYSDDLDWSENFCLRLADHPHFNVRGNAVLSFGHLARRFKTLESPESVDAIRRGLADSDEYVRGQAESAADDVEWFAKLKVRRHGLPYSHPLQWTGAAGVLSRFENGLARPRPLNGFTLCSSRRHPLRSLIGDSDPRGGNPFWCLTRPCLSPRCSCGGNRGLCSPTFRFCSQLHGV